MIRYKTEKAEISKKKSQKWGEDETDIKFEKKLETQVVGVTTLSETTGHRETIFVTLNYN